MIRKENFVEILNPCNLQQLSLSSLNGQISKIHDKYSQSEVLSLSKTGKLSIPRTNRQHLNISSPYLTLQIFIPHSKSFTLELHIIDSSVTRRKLLFTHCRGIQKDTLHCKIADSSFPREVWTNLCINLSEFTNACFGYSFQELDCIKVNGCCKIRRIFASKIRVEEIIFPSSYELPGHCTKVLVEPASIQDTVYLLDVGRKPQDENRVEARAKVRTEKRGETIVGIQKSTSHIPNKSMNYTGRKHSLLRPVVGRIESLYDNVINSLGTIRHSTPPFVHVNNESIYYDPITKSYVS